MITVTGLFDNRVEAETAIRALRDRGIGAEDISVVMRDRTETGDLADEAHVTATGGAVGGSVVGGLTGLLMGLGALAIPGVGPIIAAGPLVAALTGALTGAATGGMLGALMDLGVDESEAEVYHNGVQRGAVLVAVRTDEANAAEVRSVLNQYSRPIDEHRSRWDSDPDYRYNRESGASEALGGATGGVAGAVVGGALGGPVGAAIGAATGAAMGAAAADAVEDDSTDPGATAAGGAAGGAVGAVLGGLVAGPVGAAVGAAAGGGLGAASGENAAIEATHGN
nr:general stress protein [Ardenticatenales bacterium]